MNSKLRDILVESSYARAVAAAHLAVLALAESRSANSILRVYPVDRPTVELLHALVREMEVTEGTTVQRLSSAARSWNIADIETIVSEMTRREVSYDEAEASGLLSKLREVPV